MKKNKYEKIAAQLLLEIHTLRTELKNKRNIINNLTKYRNGLKKVKQNYTKTLSNFNNNMRKINPTKFVSEPPKVHRMNRTLIKLENQEKTKKRREAKQRQATQSQRRTAPANLKNFVKNSGVTVSQSNSKTQKKVEVS